MNLIFNFMLIQFLILFRYLLHQFDYNLILFLQRPLLTFAHASQRLDMFLVFLGLRRYFVDLHGVFCLYVVQSSLELLLLGGQQIVRVVVLYVLVDELPEIAFVSGILHWALLSPISATHNGAWIEITNFRKLLIIRRIPEIVLSFLRSAKRISLEQILVQQACSTWCWIPTVISLVDARNLVASDEVSLT